MSVRFIPLANINGRPGDKGDKGDTGTFAGATAVSVPAGDPAEVSLSGPESAKVANFKIPRGLPGTNALANDEAFATYINAVDSDTRDALEGVFVPKDAQVFFSADHGILGDASTDDTVALQSLIDNVPEGAVIRGEAGAVIRTQGMEIPPGKSVHLDFSESTLVKAGEAPIVRAEGVWDAKQSVGGVSNGRTQSTAVVTDGSVFSVGDKVKIYSSDIVQGARDPGDGRRSYQGEFATITGIDGNSLTLSPRLYDSYSTGIRIARMNKAAFSLRFGEAYAEPGTGAGWGFPMFVFRAMYRPRIEGYISSALSTGIGVTSCFGAYTNVWGENLPRDSGYIVTSNVSVSGEHHIRAGRCRHAYTDNASLTTLPNDDPASYGRSMFDTIYGSSHGDDGHPWDTHHGGVGHKFIGVTAAGVTGAPAFMLRGEYHSLIDCSAYGADAGFQIFEEAEGIGNSYSYGHRVVNFTGIGNGFPFHVRNLVTDPGTVPNVTIEGGLFEGTVGGVNIVKSQVRISDAVIRYTGTTPPSDPAARFIQIEDGGLVGSFTLEAPNISSGTVSSLVRGTSLPGSLFNRLDVDMEIDMSDTARHSTSAIADWNSTRGQVRARIRGNHSMNPSANVTEDAASQSVIMQATGNNQAFVTSYNDMALNADDRFINVRGADPVVTIRITPNADRIAGAITPGAFAGQHLYLVVTGGQVTIRNGSSYNTSLRGGTDKVLQNRESLHLMWDRVSGIWMQLD